MTTEKYNYRGSGGVKLTRVRIIIGLELPPAARRGDLIVRSHPLRSQPPPPPLPHGATFEQPVFFLRPINLRSIAQLINYSETSPRHPQHLVPPPPPITPLSLLSFRRSYSATMNHFTAPSSSPYPSPRFPAILLLEARIMTDGLSSPLLTALSSRSALLSAALIEIDIVRRGVTNAGSLPG